MFSEILHAVINFFVACGIVFLIWGFFLDPLYLWMCRTWTQRVISERVGWARMTLEGCADSALEENVRILVRENNHTPPPLFGAVPPAASATHSAIGSYEVVCFSSRLPQIQDESVVILPGSGSQALHIVMSSSGGMRWELWSVPEKRYEKLLQELQRRPLLRITPLSPMAERDKSHAATILRGITKALHH